MSAQHKTIERLEDEAALEPVRERRQRDRIRQAVRTTPAAADHHVHCVIFDGETGDGFTSPGPDGHIHKVTDLELVAVLGHSHRLSATRCTEDHNRVTGRHVVARR